MKKTEKMVKFSSIDNYYKLYHAASKLENDVIVRRGRWTVDGKSLMGLFSINFTDGAMVLYDENEQEFEQILEELNEE